MKDNFVLNPEDLDHKFGQNSELSYAFTLKDFTFSDTEVVPDFTIETTNSDGLPCNAFTLAEVLITLGIIGVVAAMTIPTLISNYKDKEVATRYAKSKSILINGFKLMMANNGVYSISGLPIVKCAYNSACYSTEFNKVFKILADNHSGLDVTTLPEKYIIYDEDNITFVPPAYAEDTESSFKWEDVPYIFQVTDGVLYGVEPNNDLQGLSVYVDINSINGPNTVKKDLYKFLVTGNANFADVSDELLEASICSVDNLEACKTSAACYSLSSYRNSQGACPYMNWNPDTNSCSIHNNLGLDWSSSYCR